MIMAEPNAAMLYAMALKKKREEQQTTAEKTVGSEQPALSRNSPSGNNAWGTWTQNAPYNRTSAASSETKTVTPEEQWQNAISQAQPMVDPSGVAMTPQNQGYVPPTRMDKFKNFMTDIVYAGSPPDPAMQANPLYQDPNKAFWLGLSQDVADSYMGKMPEGAAMRNVNQAFQANTTAPMKFLQHQSAQLALDQAENRSAGMADFLQSVDDRTDLTDTQKDMIKADPSAFITGQYTIQAAAAKPGADSQKYDSRYQRNKLAYPEKTPTEIHEMTMSSMASGTNVTVDTGMETKEKTASEVMAGLYGEDITSVIKSGRDASANVANYKRMYDLNPEVESFTGEALDKLKRNLRSLGLDFDEDATQMSGTDLFRALGAKNTLKNTALLAGAISEAELDLTSLIDGGQLDLTTKAGRQLVLGLRLGEAMKAAAVSRDFERWFAETGKKIDDEQGAFAMMEAWRESDVIKEHKNIDAFYYLDNRIQREVLEQYGRAILKNTQKDMYAVPDRENGDYALLAFLAPEAGSDPSKDDEVEGTIIEGALYYRNKANTKWMRY